jgi:hypothetical protein
METASSKKDEEGLLVPGKKDHDEGLLFQGKGPNKQGGRGNVTASDAFLVAGK